MFAISQIRFGLIVSSTGRMKTRAVSFVTASVSLLTLLYAFAHSKSFFHAHVASTGRCRWGAVKSENFSAGKSMFAAMDYCQLNLLQGHEGRVAAYIGDC